MRVQACAQSGQARLQGTCVRVANSKGENATADEMKCERRQTSGTNTAAENAIRRDKLTGTTARNASARGEKYERENNSG